MESYVITGANGYIGSMLARQVRKTHPSDRIVALVKNVQGAEASLSGLNAEIIQIDLSDAPAVRGIGLQCDYLIHCAAVTKSSEMIAHPVEVTESIVNTTQNVMELAKRSSPKSVVCLSSMEIYGDIDCSDGRRVCEEELGNVDLFQSRSCYPLGKRMAEHICYVYFKEYGIPVKIARLAQTFGKGVLPTDTRVFAQFARAAREGTDIVLHTTGDSMGNYCGINDAVSGILTILKRGTNGEAYNVVNETNTMQIRQMAELVAQRIADGKIKVVCDIPDGNIYGYAADTGLRLSGQKLMGLGWKPAQSLEDMYRDMIGSE